MGTKSATALSAKKNGGARPGAGRPKGTKPRSQAELDRLRERINAPRIAKRIGDIADGTLVVEDVQVEALRLRAGEIIMRKVWPDLQRTEHTGADGGPLEIITRAE